MNSLFNVLNNRDPVIRSLAVTATINFASIGAVTTVTSDVTVPGASIGDLVTLGLPETVDAGVVFDARVSAANTVTVRALNITAGAIDPASATYKIVVHKL